jgi:DNA-binding transcriptional LysR family regulator
MIDLAALKSLHAVSVHGSVIGAAAALGYTPSAVSQQIKRLEKQAGVGLLERAGRGVMLTEQGRRLVSDGQVLLDSMEELEAGLLASTNVVAGRLRVAAFSTSVRGLFAPVARRARAEHPDLELSLVETDPWDGVDLVSTGQVDVAVVHNWTRVPLLVPDHVSSRLLMTDVADLLVHRSNPLARRSSVTPRDLDGQPWISTPENTICYQWLLRMYDGTGMSPHVVHWSTEFASHVALVAQGVGISLNPRLGRGPLPRSVVPVKVTDPEPQRGVQVLWRSTMAASPAIRYLVEAFERAAS